MVVGVPSRPGRCCCLCSCTLLGVRHLCCAHSPGPAAKGQPAGPWLLLWVLTCCGATPPHGPGCGCSLWCPPEATSPSSPRTALPPLIGPEDAACCQTCCKEGDGDPLPAGDHP